MRTSKTISKDVSFMAINLKMLRKANSLTQEDLADIIQIKRSSIGAYEEGRADPRIKTLINICDLFEVSVDDFLKKELL